MEYDIAYGVRTMEHLHGLIAFFRAMRGRKHAFLYHDYVDYRSTIAVDEETRIAPPTGPFDQQLGIGNHVTKSFQLVKRYPTPGGLLDQIRPIYKPEQGTVQVAVGGIEVSNYTVDYARGVITFVPDFTRTGLNAMTLAAVTDKWKISNAPAGTFTGLAVGDKVSTTGWLNPINNVGEATPLIVTAVASDGTNFTCSAPAGYPMTKVQWDRLVLVIASLCRFYKIQVYAADGALPRRGAEQSRHHSRPASGISPVCFRPQCEGRQGVRRQASIRSDGRAFMMALVTALLAAFAALSGGTGALGAGLRL